MLLSKIVETSRAVAETSSRSDKTGRLAKLLRESAPQEIPSVVAFLIGEPLQGKVGVGYASVRAALEGSEAAPEPSLSVEDVEHGLAQLAAIAGAGSKIRRERALGQLLGSATAQEREFLAALLVGELRQGALEGVMVAAVAKAAKVPVASVQRALMFSGSLPNVASRAMADGNAGLAELSIQLFRPLKPMLAQPGDSVDEALSTLGEAALEYKMDGARIQVHRQGDEVRIYTRNLNEVGNSIPEVVELARALPVSEVVLDGEVLAFDPKGRPETFQNTMRRFGRTDDVESMRAQLPVQPYFFDCLYLDGEALVDEGASTRWRALQDATHDDLTMPRIVTASSEEAGAFLRRALADGHEGLLAKALDSTYDAGRRGKSWFKIKPSYTLDLVILAAEWGSGRRKGKLSNLHLGARDPDNGGFVMLGKTFKGLTDEMLEWQTKTFLELQIAREGHIVHVRPEIVAEIAFDGVQDSQRYPGGLALRFARVKRYRPDKAASEADTIGAVREIRGI